MSQATDSVDDSDTVPYIPHQEFRNGLPYGRFRIVVNPTLARPFVVRRTRVDWVAMGVISLGAVLALTGYPLGGAALVALGIAANRLVKHQAGRILLHLALTQPKVYEEVTSNGTMEVRRAA